ncbi:triose-phosphate isomerase [Desulfovibrio subterraneus]|jgi:triosephosphate isomerase|uniref:Triosephosphate isomerase n=1 Tax=Desulfovibrio subterraneus TaxID=2718620 RepID=A0A7J0BJL8_9BACT|nr:triose-phosphate isomerase [Desulfovibrio subterraneus]WBF68033.1 triose-phosphate isomerase [Desulfovibrio subterraneus]GFM33906.1 triosephosphate isomerase [Desulfovibrio subterraneus]
MKKLMAANWKMYKTADEARETARALVDKVGSLPQDREVLIFPPFTALHGTVEAVKGAAGFNVGGQDVYPADEGAFTGEISPAMLAACGCNWVLTGHSERRHVLGESNTFVGQKTAYSLAKGLKVCLCIGEKLEEREAGKLTAIIHTQLETGLKDVPADISPEVIAIAYEPVWAIGTGKVAGPKEILEAHAIVREKLVAMFPATGAQMPILYGGSVKPDNASEIVSLDNVNGVLVGGASLQADSFSRIVLA